MMNNNFPLVIQLGLTKFQHLQPIHHHSSHRIPMIHHALSNLISIRNFHMSLGRKYCSHQVRNRMVPLHHPNKQLHNSTHRIHTTGWYVYCNNYNVLYLLQKDTNHMLVKSNCILFQCNRIFRIKCIVTITGSTCSIRFFKFPHKSFTQKSHFQIF